MISVSRILQYWTSEVEHDDFDCLPIPTEFLHESETELDAEPINDIKDVVNGLSESLTICFPNMSIKNIVGSKIHSE